MSTQTQNVDSKRERLVVDLDHETKEQLEKLAEREHRTISGQVRLFIENGLAQDSPKSAVPAA